MVRQHLQKAQKVLGVEKRGKVDQEVRQRLDVLLAKQEVHWGQ